MSGTEPGWYPDPVDPGVERWWAGEGWTDQTRPSPASGTVEVARAVAIPDPPRQPAASGGVPPVPPTSPWPEASSQPPTALQPATVVGPAAAPTGAGGWQSQPPEVGGTWLVGAADPHPPPSRVQPHPPDLLAPGAPPAARGGGVPVAALAGFVVGVIVLATIVVLIVALRAEGASPADESTAELSASPPGDAGGSTSSTTAVANTVVPPPAPPSSTVPDGPVVQVRPTAVWASNERRSSRLRCGGSIGYGVNQLVDGDLGRGWGASSADGTGEHATLEFGRQVRVRRISITPGYLRVGPRWNANCASISAFPHNRHVTRVRFEFDQGEPVVVDLPARPELVPVDVDATTSWVRVTILGTVRPPGADNDTVVSEMVVEGVG